MGCFVVLFALISPRLALFVVWLFTNMVDRAFDNWLVPVLGFVFLPWTTLMYVLANDGVEVSGVGWLFVAIGLMLDIGSYKASARREYYARYV